MSSFRPPLLLRNRHVQTILSSTGPRKWLLKWRSKALRAAAKTITLHGGHSKIESQITLQGELSLHPLSKGTVVLIHGWEGSANSLYILSTSTALFAAGYNVFRLNLRDHGDTHHLNQELFNSARLNEVIYALTDLQQHLPHSVPQFLVGFSLGGNFALRIALNGSLSFKQVIAICPVINPAKTAQTLNQGWQVYHRYFVKKWKRSLKRKLMYFPQLSYGKKLHSLRTLDDMNDFFVPRFTDFASTAAYFDAYAIDGNRLTSLTTLCHIITSSDDPIININDFNSLPSSPLLNLRIQRYGGHCGFLNTYTLNSWLDAQICALLDESLMDAANT